MKYTQVLNWLKQPRNINFILGAFLVLSVFFPLKYEFFVQLDNGESEYGRVLVYFSDILILFTIFRLKKRVSVILTIALGTLASVLLHMKQGLGLEATLSSAILTYRFIAYPLTILMVGQSVKKLNLALGKIALLSGSVAAIIGLYQFCAGQSVGIPYFEGNLSVFGENVAKLPFHMELLLRAYGTFPHPNIFGLVLGICSILAISLINKTKVALFDVPILMVGIVLSFSRSIWAALANALIFSMILAVYRQKSIMFHVKHILITIAVLLTVILAFFPYIQARFSENDPSLSDRAAYQQRYTSQTNRNVLYGNAGGYIQNIKSDYPELESWEYDYPHNYWKAVTAEFGVVGILFLVFLFTQFLYSPMRVWLKNFRLKKRGIGWTALACLFMTLSFCDHYFLTSPQASLALWLSLAAFIGWGNETKASDGNLSSAK